MVTGFPFVGREDVLGELSRAREEAAVGRGGLVTLTGPAGAGKTCVAEEAAARAEGFRTLWTWCPPDAVEHALRPWSRLLRELVVDDVRCGRLAAASPPLRAVLAGSAAHGPAEVDPEAARLRLAGDVAEILTTVARRRPLLLVLDDVHAADASSLRLLMETADAVRGARVLLLATARDDDAAWQDRGWARARLLRRGSVLPVGPLRDEDVAALLDAATGRTPAPSAVHALARYTGGEAFFVTEVLRSGGGVEGPAPGATATAVSVRIRDAVRARTAGLSPRAARLLDLAALLGTRFRLDVLAEAAAVPLDEVRTLLGEAAGAGLLAEAGANEGRFRHDLLREALSGRPGPAERAELHRALATVLAGHARRGRDTGPAEVAHHLLLAGPEHAHEAAKHCHEAADRAAALLAFEEAARWYGRAVQAYATAGADISEAAGTTAGAGAGYGPESAGYGPAGVGDTGRRDAVPTTAAGTPGVGDGAGNGPDGDGDADRGGAVQTTGTTGAGDGVGHGPAGGRSTDRGHAVRTSTTGTPGAGSGAGNGPDGDGGTGREDAVQTSAAGTAGIGEVSGAGSREGVADGTLVEVLLGLGAARLGSGDWEKSRAALLRAASLARRAGRPDLLARAALGLGTGPAGFEVDAADREQADLLAEARSALAGDAAHAALRAAVTARLSLAAGFLEPEQHRVALAQEAVAAAREAEDPAALGPALAALCDARSGPDHCRERLDRSREIIDGARARHDLPLELLGRRLRLVALMETGEFAGADAEAAAYDTAARPLRQPLYAWYVPLWRGTRALMEGRHADCAAALDEVEALGGAAGSPNAALLAETQRWCLYADSGDRDNLRRLRERAPLERMPGVWPRVTLALIAAQSGQPEEASRRLAGVLPALPTLPRDSEWLPTMAQAAETVGAVGTHAAASSLYDALAPYAGLFAVEGIGAAIRGPVDRHLALLARSMGDGRAARAHRDRAVRAAAEAGASALAERIAEETPGTSPAAGSAGFTGTAAERAIPRTDTTPGPAVPAPPELRADTERLRDGLNEGPPVRGERSEGPPVQNGQGDDPLMQGGPSDAPPVHGGRDDGPQLQGGRKDNPPLTGGRSERPPVQSGRKDGLPVRGQLSGAPPGTDGRGEDLPVAGGRSEGSPALSGRDGGSPMQGGLSDAPPVQGGRGDGPPETGSGDVRTGVPAGTGLRGPGADPTQTVVRGPGADPAGTGVTGPGTAGPGASPGAGPAGAGARGPGTAGPGATGPQADAPPPPAPQFRREGPLWLLVYAGREARLPDSKGLHDIAVLLGRPGTPVPAVDLASPGGTAGDAGPAGTDAGDLHAPGDLGEVVDATARAAYRRRLRELEEEAEDADTAGDAARSRRIAEEKDALVRQLSAAYGIGGRVRRAGSPAERARTAVTARVRAAVRRVAEVHPELGRHLGTAVRTGTLCVYEPENPPAWRL
ncbi:ATP-binding protein [Streptomyces aureus]|uniref:ATP-binding protein n=1 Tax=Streptomyces aureus TaxID=193461 RepID=UPI0005603F75|nr:AAA family ATPase [Streptomyces aureus]